LKYEQIVFENSDYM